jgi:hypothetical protein
MRRLLLGLVVAATAALAPTWAMAGNQEVAEQIAAGLRDSGQLHGYKIGVKFQDGTAWLRGQVASQEQMNAALRLAFQTPGVTRVVNNLTIGGQESAMPAGPTVAQPATPAAGGPLQAVQAALGVDQTPRPVSRDMRAMQSSRGVGMERPVAQTPTPPMPYAAVAPQAPQVPAQRADRVASAFVAGPSPQINMTAAQEPTLAPPRQPVQAPAQATMPHLAGPRLPSPQMVSYQQPTAALAAAPVPVPAAAVPVAVPPPAAAPIAAPVPVPVPVPVAAPVPTPAAAIPATQPMVPMAGAPLPLGATGAPMPMGVVGAPLAMVNGQAPMRFDQPNLPNYAWPTYAPYPNYAALTYPKQYSPTAWPYIGPFYPYPQVPLGWRKVSLEWSDGWWFLDFDDGTSHGPFSGLFRSHR